MALVKILIRQPLSQLSRLSVIASQLIRGIRLLPGDHQKLLYHILEFLCVSRSGSTEAAGNENTEGAFSIRHRNN